jgi:hypothetical protein
MAKNDAITEKIDEFTKVLMRIEISQIDAFKASALSLETTIELDLPGKSSLDIFKQNKFEYSDGFRVVPVKGDIC